MFWHPCRKWTSTWLTYRPATSRLRINRKKKLRQTDQTNMIIERSDRTVRDITAKELLHRSDLDDLKQHGFTLAQPICIQISAKAARGQPLYPI